MSLAGTLTRPKRAERAAAILLIPGSGTQDRDESLCGHRPFLVLADHLTRCGLIVLRLDDRGAGGSTGDKDECSHEELFTDVETALGFLAGHEAVDGARLGLVGHSEGACLAAAAAAQFTDVAFVVLMACAAGRGEDGIHEQSALIARAAGASEEQIAHEHRMNDAVFAVLETSLDAEAARAAIRPVFSRFLRTWPGGSAPARTGDSTGTSKEWSTCAAPAFRSSLTCDFGEYLRRVSCPVLALYGGLDLQVPPSSNVPRLRRALATAGNTQVTVEEFPTLNHLFQTATTGALSEYEQIEETMAPVVLDRISMWIAACGRESCRPATALQVDEHLDRSAPSVARR